MPIRINLLAEAQALEEMRRRDPVKRVILGGIVAVFLILAWSSSLLFQTVLTKSELSTAQSNLNARTNDYGQILQNQKTLEDDKQRLLALHQLALNRFLVGNLLNALQQATLDNVQLVRMRLNQTYQLTEATKPRASGERGASRPATATEKIGLTLNARDTSPVPGDAVNRFQSTLASTPYFQETLGKLDEFRLSALGTPQTDPDGKSFVLFTLDASYPDKTR